jgi:hypothetical protein
MANTVPKEEGTKSETKKKSAANREDSLINRSSKPNVDELINAIVKSRHQLMTFSNDEAKFMSTLKMKAIEGMTSVQDKSFMMAASKDSLSSQSQALD